MSDVLSRLRSELTARCSRIIDAGIAGIGVEFRDGNDVWWLLPEDPLSSMPLSSTGVADLRAIVKEYERLDALRTRAIHAIRHHLADQGVRTTRDRSGRWLIQNGTVSSELSVGASLTARFAGSDDVVAAVREVFARSIIRKPSPRRIQRYLTREGDPRDELPWLDDPPTLTSDHNPMAILAMMGLCNAIRLLGQTADESHPPRPEELAEAVQPRGRIGRALARCAAAFPETRASLGLDGAMAINFDDGLDSYRVHPRSRDLVASIRRDGPERAGDELIAEFRRLNADRARVITAVREGLPRLGFSIQDERARLHYGRGAREATLDLGKPLTEALRQGTARDAVRALLSANPDLAEEVADAVSPERPDRLPEPSTAVLRPPAPPPVPLPPIAELDLARLDQLARSILDRYLEDREVLRGFFDPLLHDRASDTWATREDWLRAANRFRGESFTNPDAELIRLELGVTEDLHGWLAVLGGVGYHGENSEAEIISVYRYRRENPDIAREWFAPGPFEDCPEAETRSRVGDWIAARYLATSIDPEDDVGRPLSRLSPAALEVFFEAGQIERWRNQAVRTIDEAWDWFHFDEGLLTAAAVHRWTEVGEALERNPYLVHTLLNNDRMLMSVSARLLPAWSRLAPSAELARLVGMLLGRDLHERAVTLAKAMAGTLAERRPELVSQFADRWLTELQRSLAIAWTRSRSFIKG